MSLKQTITVGAMAVAVTASVLATAPVAAAQAAPNNCPNAKLCVYEDNDYEGGILILDVPLKNHVGHPAASDFKINDFAGMRFSNGHPVNDNISSVANKTKVDIRFFQNAGFGGEQFQLPAGEFFSTVGLQNDSFSSVGSISH
jgi:hypothetical protein